MAKTKLSAAGYVERGYAQVEPNHLSAQRTGQIYAQLPLADDLQIENGQFVKYDYAAKENGAKGEVNLTGAGEWMLVFNEVKVYGDRETAEDFVMSSKKNNKGEVVSTAAFGNPVPRVFKTNVGDIMTTNAIAAKPTEGATLIVGEDGFLKAGTHETDMVWQVAKVYTLADGQPAAKIIRIQ